MVLNHPNAVHNYFNRRFDTLGCPDHYFPERTRSVRLGTKRCFVPQTPVRLFSRGYEAEHSTSVPPVVQTDELKPESGFEPLKSCLQNRCMNRPCSSGTTTYCRTHAR